MRFSTKPVDLVAVGSLYFGGHSGPEVQAHLCLLDLVQQLHVLTLLLCQTSSLLLHTHIAQHKVSYTSKPWVPACSNT